MSQWGRKAWMPFSGRVYDFVQDLKADIQVQQQLKELKTGQVLSLGSVWFGGIIPDLGKEIFVRSCYDEILRARNAYLECSPQEARICAVTGTPGIGKSHLGALAAARALVEGRPVLLQTAIFFLWLSIAALTQEYCNTETKVCCEFTRDPLAVGMRLLTSRKAQQNTFCLVDGRPPGNEHAAFLGEPVDMLIISSPCRELERAIHKHEVTLTLYMPLCSLEELHSMRSSLERFRAHKQAELLIALALLMPTESCQCAALSIKSSAVGVPKTVVTEWYNAAGGVPRSCLLGPATNCSLENWRKQLQYSLSRLTAETLEAEMTAAVSAAAGAAATPDRAFHWTIGEPLPIPGATSPRDYLLRRYKTHTLQLASPMVEAMMLMALHCKGIFDIVTYILRNSSLQDRSATCGHWFESLVHSVLCTGGSFRCRRLSADRAESSEFQLELPAASAVHRYADSHDAARHAAENCSVYCLPYASNAPAIDSLRSPAAYFQITTADSHTLKKAAIYKMVEDMRIKSCDGLVAAASQLAALTCPQQTFQRPILFIAVPKHQYNTHYKHACLFVDKQGKVLKGRSQKAPIEQVALEIDLEARARVATKPAECRRVMQELAANLPSGTPAQVSGVTQAASVETHDVEAARDTSAQRHKQQAIVQKKRSASERCHGGAKLPAARTWLRVWKRRLAP